MSAARPLTNPRTTERGVPFALCFLSSCLVFSSFLSGASDNLQALALCVDRKDEACVLACLKDAPASRSPEYLALAARAYVLVGQNQEALRCIDQAVKLNPRSYDYLMEQGWLYQRSGDQVSAIRSFLLASQIDARSPAVFYELGMSFFLAQEYERSIRHFEHTIQLDHKNDKAEFMLGVVEIWRGRLEQAKVHFGNALKLQPHNAHYLLHYGVLLAKLLEPDLALTTMLEARTLDPSNPLTHYQIGKRYREMEKFTEARQELEIAVRLRPTLSPALYQLGAVYRKLGEEEKAREAFKKFELLAQQEKQISETQSTPISRIKFSSRDQGGDNITCDVSEPEIAALKFVSQLRVIEAKQLQQRSV